MRLKVQFNVGKQMGMCGRDANSHRNPGCPAGQPQSWPLTCLLLCRQPIPTGPAT